VIFPAANGLVEAPLLVVAAKDGFSERLLDRNDLLAERLPHRVPRLGRLPRLDLLLLETSQVGVGEGQTGLVLQLRQRRRALLQDRDHVLARSPERIEEEQVPPRRIGGGVVGVGDGEKRPAQVDVAVGAADDGNAIRLELRLVLLDRLREPEHPRRRGLLLHSESVEGLDHAP